MKRYDDTTYGERIAEVYDQLYSDFELDAVDLLEELGRGGRVLELGIGTGRIALPLRGRGMEVVGIDASEAMIEKLRSKPGGTKIQVAKGSFADVAVDGEFDLVYVVFNTFFALLTQEAQVQCFRGVAAHLTQAGLFLIEVFVPNLTRYDDNQAVRASQLSEDSVRLEVSRLDPISQQVSTQHVLLGEDGLKLYPVKVRFAWPSELDLMAELAGLRLKHRWSSWDKADFTSESRNHISVYGRSD
jgi:SAM-dependent methyltransferase